MKKFLACILIVMTCLSLVACGSGQPENGNSGNGSSSAANIIGKDLNGDICIKPRKFGSIIERIELTMENWQDYIKVVSYDKTEIERNVFGDVISQTTETNYLLGTDTDRYHVFDFNRTAIELKNISTGETTIYTFGEFGRHVDENFNLDDYECIRIQGILYFLDIPEEVILQSDYQKDHGTGSFIVGNSSWNWTIEVDVDAKVVSVAGYNLDNYLD